MGETLITFGGIAICGLLIIYSVLGVFIEKVKPPCGHEAAAVIILGMIISYLGFLTGEEEIVKMMEFSSDFFFFFCLPPIVFNSAFNMRRKVFF